MALYTSYLAFLKHFGYRINQQRTFDIDGKETEFLFVMRGRGNSPVEPPAMVLRLAKEGAITWEGYRDAYLASLENQESLLWMQQVAKKAFDHDVVLICFERSPEHCHRRLLAEYIRDYYGVEYGGELHA